MFGRRVPSPPELLLEEIDRLYRELRELPGWTRTPSSAAYLAIEAQIRACADRYRALERASEEAASLKAAS